MTRGRQKGNRRALGPITVEMAEPKLPLPMMQIFSFPFREEDVDAVLLSLVAVVEAFAVVVVVVVVGVGVVVDDDKFRHLVKFMSTAFAIFSPPSLRERKRERKQEGGTGTTNHKTTPRI